MGKLIDGVWKDVWYDTERTGGRFRREQSRFRNWVTTDGSAGTERQRRFRGRAGPLSPLCLLRLSRGRTAR